MLLLKLQPTTHLIMDSIVLEESPSTTAYGGTGGGGGGGRAIDRHNPIIRDEKRLTQGRIFPFTSNITQLANSPHHHKKKSPETAKKHQEQVAGGGDRKKKSVAIAGGTGDDNELINPNDFISPATSSRYLLSDRATFNFSSEFDHVPPPPPPPPPREPLVFHNYSKIFEKKDDDILSSPPPTPLPPPSPPPTEGLTFFDDDDDSPSYSPPKPPPPPPPPPLEFHNYKASNKKHQNSSYSATRKPPSPPPPPPPPPEPLEFHNYKASNKKFEDSSSSATRKPPSPPPPPPPSSDQVVVLEVSLHCRGCERKMRKHISKIQGVTSFKIEFAAKKVTVVGDVTPLAVLTSVLKVKSAKLLNPATISSSSSTANH